MRTAGWISNASDGDKCADSFTCAHEHTVSHPDVDQHTGIYPYSDECAYADFGAVGNSYTHPDGRTVTNKHTHAESDSNQHSDAGGYGHTDSYKYTVTDTCTNRDECPNSHINTRDIDVIVTHARPHCDASTHKLAYADSTTYCCPDPHAHTDSRAHRDPLAESHRNRGWRRDNRVHLLRRSGVETGAGRVRGDHQRGRN